MPESPFKLNDYEHNLLAIWWKISNISANRNTSRTYILVNKLLVNKGFWEVQGCNNVLLY